MQAGVGAASMLAALARVAESEAAADDLFATVWLGWLDAGGTMLRMGSLGHPSPLLLTDGVRYLDCTPAPPLGVVSDPEWLPSEVELPGTWTLVLYTDGLVEGRAAPGASERFGAERLQAWFADRDGAAVDGASLQALISALEREHGGNLPDDVAILVLARRSAGVPT